MTKRKDFVKKDLAQESRAYGPFIVLLNLTARRLHQLAVLHAGRASGLTSAAIQAKVDMLDERPAERQPALLHLDHLKDSSARGIHFQAQFAIGGARIQAETAVDTL